jgi:hypothetical protein
MVAVLGVATCWLAAECGGDMALVAQRSQATLELGLSDPAVGMGACLDLTWLGLA